ncbi:MAG: nitroreductase family protein [Candidatus Thermoplasmatota archaeon]|nr:nitroreductase family protein [Candidatus Thermoplasmatota archaeon]
MDVADAIRARRALRVLSDRSIGNEAVNSLVEAARLAPSCFNNQPWRFIFAQAEPALSAVKDALPGGNNWATRAPLIIAVAARRDDDCKLSDGRDYFLFDCGLSVSQLILRAVELNLIAHPIAGYDPEAVKKALGIPEDYVVITLIVCAHQGDDDSLLSEKQREIEPERPERDPIDDDFFLDSWGNPFTE